MRLNRPFIRLPYQFDAARLAAEVERFSNQQWMPHPSGLPGNSAIALISSGGGDNNSFEGEKHPTPHLARCPYMQQVMASFGEVLSRSRLMRPGAGRGSQPARGFQLPLVQPGAHPHSRRHRSRGDLPLRSRAAAHGRRGMLDIRLLAPPPGGQRQRLSSRTPGHRHLRLRALLAPGSGAVGRPFRVPHDPRALRTGPGRGLEDGTVQQPAGDGARENAPR